jgi:hypothetical protein
MPAWCEILVEKRQRETLTPGEHEKLLQLTERFEALNVQRIEEVLVALCYNRRNRESVRRTWVNEFQLYMKMAF